MQKGLLLGSWVGRGALSYMDLKKPLRWVVPEGKEGLVTKGLVTKDGECVFCIYTLIQMGCDKPTKYWLPKKNKLK